MTEPTTKIDCWHCGKAYLVADKLAGRSVRCTGCGFTMLVPGVAGASTAPGVSDMPGGANTPEVRLDALADFLARPYRVQASSDAATASKRTRTEREASRSASEGVLGDRRGLESPAKPEPTQTGSTVAHHPSQRPGFTGWLRAAFTRRHE